MANQDFRLQQYSEAFRLFGPDTVSHAWGAKGRHSPFYFLCNATQLRCGCWLLLLVLVLLPMASAAANGLCCCQWLLPMAANPPMAANGLWCCCCQWLLLMASAAACCLRLHHPIPTVHHALLYRPTTALGAAQVPGLRLLRGLLPCFHVP